MEDSDSDSTPSLHDIDWSSEDTFFDYEDPSSLSPQIWAVIEDDVSRLKALLEAGKSVNVNDNAGNTPLHVAIRKNRRQAFDFLINVPDVRIDATNFEVMTPLMLALGGLQEHYAIKLLEKGANVNLTRDTGYTPLHYSIGLNVEIAHMMLKMGAKIDAQNCNGATPLLLACEENKSDLIHLLLLKGADPTIPDHCGMLPVTQSILTCSEDLQEILFNYTFDEDGGKNEVSLFTLITTMTTRPQFFYKLVDTNCDVFYKQSDLQRLADRLYGIEPEIFRVFLNKFELVAREFFRFYNPFKCCECHHLGSNLNVNLVEFLYILCETEFIGAIAEQSAQNWLTHTLICQKLPEDTLTKVLFSLLSHGVDLTSCYFSMVYKHYGFGDLFKLLLHIDIVKRGPTIGDDFIMPQLIYDLSFNVGNIAAIAGSVVDSEILELLSKFFKVAYRRIPVEPPSLVELARKSARDFVIKKYKIRNNIHFFTVLKWLPINDIYKQILSFERRIYP